MPFEPSEAAVRLHGSLHACRSKRLNSCCRTRKRNSGDSSENVLREDQSAVIVTSGKGTCFWNTSFSKPTATEEAARKEARPGRIDLAVEIPLPDRDARRSLFTLYARDIGLSGEALDIAADRAEGVTASFAKELIRRACCQRRSPNVLPVTRICSRRWTSSCQIRTPSLEAFWPLDRTDSMSRVTAMNPGRNE